MVLTTRRALLGGAAAFCATSAYGGCAPPFAPRSIDVAVSLRQLNAELQNCATAGRCKPEVRALYGLSQPAGIVTDPSGDLILVGPANPQAPALDVDDLVTALRNTFGLFGTRTATGVLVEAPGVSIDPDPAVWRRLSSIGDQAGTSQGYRDAWTQTCAMPMDTRVMGVPEGRTAAVMMQADYLMKTLTNGTAQLTLPGFTSLHDAQFNAALKGQSQVPGQGNRFWFTPGAYDYARDAAGVLLETAQVQLQTEAQHFSAVGTLTDSGADDPLAQRFACAFSARYPEIAATPSLTIYKELDDIFRWVALSRIIRDEKLFEHVGFAPKYLIEDWALRRASIPATLPGRARVSISQGGGSRLFFSTCGGVSVDFANGLGRTDNPTRAPGEISPLVLAARPSPSSIAWALS